MQKEDREDNKNEILEDFDEQYFKRLYELSDGLASLVLAKPKKFMAMTNAPPGSKERQPRWELRPFKNPARSDDMVLWRWENTSMPRDEPYYFSCFNKKIKIPHYDDDEYALFLEDQDWTRFETDAIFALCHLYDMKWYAIADRYMEYLQVNSKGQQVPIRDRSVDDIKDRYYTVLRLLSKARTGAFSSGDRSEELLPPEMYQFKKSEELERKANLIRLYNRTREQIKNEEALYMELCLRSQLHAEFEKDKEALSKLLSEFDFSHPNSTRMTHAVKQVCELVQDRVNSHKQKQPKKKRIISGADSSVTSVRSTSYRESTPDDAYKSSSLSQLGDFQNSDQPETSQKDVHGDHVNTRYLKYPIGVFVRSSRIMMVKSSIAAKVEHIMNENGIPPRPTYPTKECCDKHNELKTLVQTLISLKKHADRLSFEYKKLKNETGRDGSDLQQDT